MRVGLQAAIVNKLLWSWKMSKNEKCLITSQFPASNCGQYLLCARVSVLSLCAKLLKQEVTWSGVLHRAMMSLCFLLVLAWLYRWVCSWFQRADHHKANLRSLFPVLSLWTNCNVPLIQKWHLGLLTEEEKKHFQFGLMFEETTEALSQWWVREKCFCFVKDTQLS